MGAVHIGIGHDDDLVIPEPVQIELIPDARAQGRDDGLELVVAVDLVCPGLLHVQHLAPQGENGLEPGIPPLGGGAACGVSLDDIELRQLRIVLIAVPQLIRHGGAAESRLAADGFPGLFGGLSRPIGSESLIQDHPAHLGVLLQEDLQLFGDDVIHQGPDLTVAQLRLGLALKLGLCQLDGNDAGEALPAVLAGDLLVILQQLDLPAVGVQHIGESPLEALLVHAALRRVDVVGEGEDRLVIAVVILHGHFRHGVLSGSGHVNHVVVKHILALVQPGNKLPDAALEAHVVLLLPSGAGVHSADAQGVKGIVIVLRILEHLRVRLEGDSGAGVVCISHNGHGLGHIAPGELHLIDMSVPVDLDRQPFGKGVHHTGAHAVETAGDLVAPTAELAAGVEDGVHYLQGGLAGLGLDVHGDATAIVHHGDGVPLVDSHQDVGAVAGQCLVDGVVHDLIDQMVQAGGGRGADIHAGPLPDGFQAFQHLNFRCVVLVGRVHRSGVQQFIFCHAGSPFRIFISVPRQEEPGRSRLRPVSPCPEPCKLESSA